MKLTLVVLRKATRGSGPSLGQGEMGSCDLGRIPNQVPALHGARAAGSRRACPPPPQGVALPEQPGPSHPRPWAENTGSTLGSLLPASSRALVRE